MRAVFGSLGLFAALVHQRASTGRSAVGDSASGSGNVNVTARFCLDVAAVSNWNLVA